MGTYLYALNDADGIMSREYILKHLPFWIGASMTRLGGPSLSC